MVEEDIYTYRKLPWMSKSSILGYRFCAYLFNLRYNKGRDMGVQISAETGTNMHVLYVKFFELMDYDELVKINIDYTEDIVDTRVYEYFFKHLIEMIPANSRSFEPYQIRVANFALLEAAHWIELSRKYKESYNKIRKYFEPLMMERYLECEPLLIFGTLDRKNKWEEDDKIGILYDYKTGHVPKDVKKGTKDNNPFSWTIPTNKSFELHFYLILVMHRRGFIIDPALIEFCTNDKWFYEGVELPDVKSVFYERKIVKGREKIVPVNPRDHYRIGIIYTGNTEPWVPKKLPNTRSLKSVFVWINKIRRIIKDEGPYNKEPSYWKCRNCNETVQKDCLNELERKTIFWGEANGSKTDV